MEKDKDVKAGKETFEPWSFRPLDVRMDRASPEGDVTSPVVLEAIHDGPVIKNVKVNIKTEEEFEKEIRGEEQFQRGEIVIGVLRKAMIEMDSYHNARQMIIKGDVERLTRERAELGEWKNSLDMRLDQIIKREGALNQVREDLAQARTSIRAGVEREKAQSDRIIKLRTEVANLKTTITHLEKAIVGITNRHNETHKQVVPQDKPEEIEMK